MLLFLLLVFLTPVSVQAEVIETPYLLVGEVDASYQVSFNERLDKKTFYLLEEDQVLTKDYYFEGTAPKEYPLQSKEFIMTSWTKWGAKKKGYEEKEIRTIYRYQKLEKIRFLVLKDVINIGLVAMTVSKKQQKLTEFLLPTIPYYPSAKNSLMIDLGDFYEVEDLVFSVTTFLLQEDVSGSFVLEDEKGQFLHQKVTVTDQGMMEQSIKLINCLQKLQFSSQLFVSYEEDFSPYLKFVEKQKQYRYRRRKYRYQKIPQKYMSEVAKREGFHVLKTIEKYHLYRKEQLELYDEVIFKDYIDLDVLVKNSSFPLSKLQVDYQPFCGRGVIRLSYRDFSYLKEVEMNCMSFPKSYVTKGDTFSFFRLFFSQVVKMSIEN